MSVFGARDLRGNEAEQRSYGQMLQSCARLGANVANGTIVPAGADGQICVYASAASQVIIDVAGYMAAGVFVPLNADGSATRVLNTRGF